MTLKIISVQGFRTDEIQKLQAAVILANLATADPEFKQNVTDSTFTFTNDTGVEVFQRLSAQDWPLDCAIITPSFWKRLFSKEVAHESPDGVVTFDRNKFQGEDIPSLVNTVVHEATHVAGYGHPFYECHERDNSVPYQVGGIVEKIARRIRAGSVPQPMSVAMDHGLPAESEHA